MTFSEEKTTVHPQLAVLMTPSFWNLAKPCATVQNCPFTAEQRMSMSLLYWGAEQWAQLSKYVLSALNIGKGHLLRCAGSALPKAAQEMLLAFAARAHGWLAFKLSTRSLLEKLLCRRLVPNLCMRLFLPRYRTVQFPLLNFMWFLFVRYSSLSRSLWMAAHASGVSTNSPIIFFFAFVVDVPLQVGNCRSYWVLNG